MVRVRLHMEPLTLRRSNSEIVLILSKSIWIVLSLKWSTKFVICDLIYNFYLIKHVLHTYSIAVLTNRDGKKTVPSWEAVWLSSPGNRRNVIHWCMRILFGRLAYESFGLVSWTESNMPPKPGGGVLPRMLDRGVLPRFVRKRKLIPFLGTKAGKWRLIQSYY